MDKKFKVSIEKQEDGSYIAYNTNMSGCTIIGTGDSVAAAKKDFLESMAGATLTLCSHNFPELILASVG